MNNFPVIKQQAQLILDKSNSLISITNKILSSRSTALATALQYKPFVQIGHIHSVNSVAFSPDGKTALSGSGDGVLKLWDIGTGKEIRTLNGHIHSVNSIAFSPDGQTALSGSEDKTVKLWDITTGAVIRTFTNCEKSAYVKSISFSPDGKTFLSGNWDGILKLWDISTGEELRTFEGGRLDVFSATFSPDGEMAISGGFSTSVKLWDIDTGREITTLKGHRDCIETVAFSPDGKTALSGSRDKTLKLWDIDTGREIRTFKGHKNWVRSVTYSPDGKTALSGCRDKTLKLWNIVTGEEIHTFKGHKHDVEAVAFSPDGKMALSGSEDCTLRLWDISTGKVIRKFEDHESMLFSVAYSPDGKTALSGGWDDILKLWDINTGKLIITFKGHRNCVESVAFSPDGKTALSGSRDKTLKLWDIGTGREIRTFEGHISWVKSVAFSPDGKSALSGSEDNTLRVWDIWTGKEIRIFKGHKESVNFVAFSPDGQTALSGSEDKTVKLWDITTGAVIRTIEGDYINNVNSIALNPNGNIALSESIDGKLKLWDIWTGKEIRIFDEYAGWVHSITFSPDGKMALSGSNDGSIKLWDISTGKEIRTFKGCFSQIRHISFSPDGKTALSGSWEGALKLWDIKTGEVIRTMFAFKNEEWVTITPEGYFNHSKKGKQYLNVLTSPLSAMAIDDVTYNYYYRPNEFLDNENNNEMVDKLEENRFEIEIDNNLIENKNQKINPYQDLILELASIFEDYRKDEGLNPNPAIVERWINQFSTHNREIILSEMIHIFKRMYISEQKVDDFLLGLTMNSKLTNGNPSLFWKNVSLLNIQQDGESQKIMIEKFRTLILNQFGINVAINDFSKNHYIYVDDLLFSGMKLRTDLTYFLERAPLNAKIDVIYIGYFTSGEYYVKEKWFRSNNQKNITLNVWRMFELENRNNCHQSSDILMPMEEITQQEKLVNDFIELQGQWIARNIQQPLTNQCCGNNLFSSEENRKILEKEFTLAGLKINSSIRDQNKKAYWKPLGLSTFKGLGFGAMITTYRNCPNNTPLALWWGDWDNNQTWTPLFNRKTYNRSSIHHDQL